MSKYVVLQPSCVSRRLQIADVRTSSLKDFRGISIYELLDRFNSNLRTPKYLFFPVFPLGDVLLPLAQAKSRNREGHLIHYVRNFVRLATP